MKLCDVKRYIIGALLLGIGIGIFFSRCFGWGYFFALLFVGVGVWSVMR